MCLQHYFTNTNGFVGNVVNQINKLKHEVLK